MGRSNQTIKLCQRKEALIAQDIKCVCKGIIITDPVEMDAKDLLLLCHYISIVSGMWKLCNEY
jgi:hypothetical protein